jgi:NADPH:quinone reductase-like Zn-dependent oxidoreductase
VITMKALVQDTYGDPGVLRIDDIDLPTVGVGDVLVRVHAAGIDAGVWHLMTGMPYLTRMGFGLTRPRHRVRGRDFSGVVEAVGNDVTDLAPGDEVYGTSVTGAFADYVAVPAERVVRKPANVTFAQAAAVPVSACTALRALRDNGRLTAGQKVLVLGASGGVGSYAVQIAKALGAEVAGVCSTAKLDFVRSLGADHVVDYSTTDPVDGSETYDLIVDTGGNRPVQDLRKALTAGGTLALVGGEGGGNWTGGFGRQLRAPLLSPFVGQRLTAVMSSERASDLEELSRLMESGALVPPVDRTFALDEGADAIRYYMSGAVRGKAVITMVPA